MRYRLLLITIGAVLVALTFTFPSWFQFFQREQPVAQQEVFPGLSADMQLVFQALPPDQQAAYRAIAEEDRAKAVAMIEAALQPGIPAPTEQQAMPEMAGAEAIATGEFTRIDAIRWAQGNITIYQQADESKILRFEPFSIANGPGLRVALALTPPAPVDEMDEPTSPIDYILVNGLDLGPLWGTSGNQNYDIAPEIDVTQYDRVVIFSPTLEMIYSIAPLTF
jgi:hypothetical protein